MSDELPVALFGVFVVQNSCVFNPAMSLRFFFDPAVLNG
jgi:hypothetical protein